jgi:hypothetical protein
MGITKNVESTLNSLCIKSEKSREKLLKRLSYSYSLTMFTQQQQHYVPIALSFLFGLTSEDRKSETPNETARKISRAVNRKY